MTGGMGYILAGGGIVLASQFAAGKENKSAQIPRVFLGTFVAAAIDVMLPEEIGNPLGLLFLVSVLYVYGPPLFKAMGF